MQEIIVTIKIVKYTITTTWKNEPRLLLAHLFRCILKVILPFITILYPTLLVMGLTKEISYGGFYILVISTIVITISLTWLKTTIDRQYEVLSMNNKMKFLVELFRSRMNLPYAYMESAEGQTLFQVSLKYLLNDNLAANGLLLTLEKLVGSFISVCLYLGFVLQFSWPFAAFIFSLSVVQLATMNRLGKYKFDLSESLIQEEKKSNYIFSYVSSIKAYKDIILYSLQGLMKEKSDQIFRQKRKKLKKTLTVDFFMGMVDILLMSFRDIVAYSVIIAAVVRETITVADFLFYFGVITSFSQALTGVTASFSKLIERSREVERIKTYIAKATKVPAIDTRIDNSDTLVALKNISYCYDDHHYAIKDVTFNIRRGEKIALIGENGSGKSTLIKILCNLYKPSKGTITFNVDQDTITEGSFHSVVFQDIFLLPLSLGENISMNDDYIDKDIQEVIENTGLADVTGLDLKREVTKTFSEEGLALSGGETQRVGIARAAYRVLYKQAELMLLDEPTSALDPIAERNFYELYEKVIGDTTSIFVSHRLASTKFCDRIIVLAKGRIVEEGTHDELIAKKGKYHELYQIQSAYYK